MSIEELLQDTLDERGGLVRGDDDLARNVIHRARHRRGQRVRVGLAALVIAVLVVVLALNQALPRTANVSPDPRGTAVPSISAGTPTGWIPGVTTTYRVVQGPPAVAGAGLGAPVSVMPRVERRGTRTWLVTSTASVALPTSVNGARSIQRAGSSWVVFAISDGFTGGDTDAGAQILVVTANGTVRSLVTGAVRSVAVSLDGTQVASVETVERPTWSITLLVRRVADGGVVRKVALPYGQPGEWPYGALAWTPEGILASYQSGAITAPGATVLVSGGTVSDLAPLSGIYGAPDSMDLYTTWASAGTSCLGFRLKTTTTPAASATILCGRLGVVTPLEAGRVLVQFSESDGTKAILADTVAGTVTLLTYPSELRTAFVVGAVAESADSVLVPNFATGQWWRWNITTNSAELAPRPSGTSAVISW